MQRIDRAISEENFDAEETASMLLMLGTMQKGLKDYSAAKAAYEQALALDPLNPETLLSLARLLLYYLRDPTGVVSTLECIDAINQDFEGWEHHEIFFLNACGIYLGCAKVLTGNEDEGMELVLDYLDDKWAGIVECPDLTPVGELRKAKSSIKLEHVEKVLARAQEFRGIKPVYLDNIREFAKELTD